MFVLVNATTLVKGGAIQVAASFISECLKQQDNIRWHYAISSQVAAELKSLGVIPVDVTIFDRSPSKSRAQRERLKTLERELSPDVVFSVFGPSYVRFSAPHLCGVAVGWVTHSTRLAFSLLPNWKSRILAFLKYFYIGCWLRMADRWVVEAENAKTGMRTRLRIPSQKIDVVPNSCAAIFVESGLSPALQPKAGEVVRLLYLSAYYPHKNIEFVPRVAAELKRLAPNQQFEFMVTLPADDPGYKSVMAIARNLGVSNIVKTAGKVSLKEVIEIYRGTHICFMSSVLETFSATYPEAMALGRPIVTADLDFARAVCRDAAVYFQPQSEASAAQAILKLVNDEAVWKQSIESGYEVLAGLPTAQGKYEKYVEAIRATADMT